MNQLCNKKDKNTIINYHLYNSCYNNTNPSSLSFAVITYIVYFGNINVNVNTNTSKYNE